MMHGRFGKWMAVLFLVLLVNTAYLAAFASPTIFYMSETARQPDSRGRRNQPREFLARDGWSDWQKAQ